MWTWTWIVVCVVLLVVLALCPYAGAEAFLNTCNKTHVAVLMMNSPGIHSYAGSAAVNNYLYAKKHGYGFVVESCPAKEDLGKDRMWKDGDQYLFVWSKPGMIRRHLVNYDYLVFIDSDAVVFDMDKTVESFVEEHFDDSTCIVLGEDCKDAENCYGGGAKEVMVVKNTEKTMGILDHWIQAASDECSEFKYTHPREQACINILGKTAYPKEIKVVPYRVIQGHDGVWIQHILGESKENRDKIIHPLAKKRLDAFVEKK